jgi:hypothetical protein
MPHEQSKGMAGMGSRGKNKPKDRQDKATAKRTRKTGGGANLTTPAKTARGNQKRNQKEWASAREMSLHY